jgi:protein-S-isoprenylcysteine O-methyltransferase Ste14
MRPYRFYQAAAFKLRGFLMVPWIVFLFCWRTQEWEFELGNWILGGLAFLSGILVRVVSQRYLNYRLRQDRALAIDGPYAWVRNPVYIGNILIIAGLCLLCELPWMVPPACLWAWLVYDSAIRFEEYRLIKRYGAEYETYRDGVRRWLPRKPALGSATNEPETGWWRAVGVEWQCFVLLIIPAAKEIMF